jgi:Flp pilus assembly protein TadD
VPGAQTPASLSTAMRKDANPISMAVIGSFVLVFALLIISSFLQKSPTVDEPVHLFAGYSSLKWGDFRANPEHPPLAKIWAALPLLALDIKDSRSSSSSWNLIPRYSPTEIHTVNAAGEMIFRENDARALFFYAKLQMIVLGIVLGVFVYLWSKKLFGLEAGIASVFVYCLDPNILAHGQLVHTDITFTTFFFIGTYFFWRALNRLTWTNLVLTALFFGLAANTKYAYLAILVVWGILGVLKVVSSEPQGYAIVKAGELRTRREKAVALMGVFGCVLATTYFLIWALYDFRFSAIPGGILHLPMAQEMPKNPMLHGFVSFLVNYELFPEAWIYGQLYVFNNLHRFAYLLGQHSDKGFWLYFPVTFAVKTPLPTLLLIVWTIALWIYERRERRTELFLLVPVVVYFSLAVLSRINIGLRHILPIYPFLFVLIGGTVAQLWQSGTWFKKTAVALLGLWYLWSSASVYPHYLTFFNEIAGGPKNGHRIAVDSNLDWGQDLPGLKEWMDANGVKKIQFLYFGFYGAAEPQYYGIDAVYLPGSWVTGDSPVNKSNDVPAYLAISATHLYGPVPDVEEFVKPFTTIAPIATVGHSIYIYSMERAIEQLHQAVQLHPASAVAHHDLAILLENQGKVDEAMYHYRVALQIDPVYKKVNYQMANSLTKWGEVERAINHYRLVLETDSSYADAHESLGLLLALRGELTGATEHFYQALKLDPTRSETHFHLGVALAKQSDFAEAAKQFREALRIKPDYAEAYNNLGRVLAAQGQLDRAIEFFRQAVQIKPNFAEAHQSLAIALDEKGRKDEAAQELQEAASLMQSRPLAETTR